MIRSIAWKNIWRNKKRSLVVITAVTLGIIAGVLLVGIMQGWVEQRMHDAVYNEVSHVQIHNKGYIDNEEIDLTVQDIDLIEKELNSIPGITAWVKRTKVIAMASTPWANSGVVIYGINPDAEKRVTEIHKRIVTAGGSYPDSQKSGEILISDKTAEILKLKQYNVTDKVIETLREEGVPSAIISKLDSLRNVRFRSPVDFTEELHKRLNSKELDKYGMLIMDKALDYRIRNKIQVTLADSSGTPVQGTFRVCGIFKTNNTGFDQVSVFVNSEELSGILSTNKPLIHEIAILLDNIEDADAVKEKLAAVNGNNAVQTWKELAPDAALMNDYMVLYYFIFIGIIMLALAFGIINTMLMAILERTRELGMLMAIGMNRKRVFSMIMLETIFLTSVGAVVGMAAGWAITSILGKTGIHFSGWGEGFEAMGYSARVFPVITPDFFVFVTVMVIATAIIASLWPARKALKLNPVEALRTD
ncbi:MAG: ABC transporter permease [Bacteroidales bacterium]|nr:ABC transporter permease [Bacteroidales bacterium]